MKKTVVFIFTILIGSLLLAQDNESNFMVKNGFTVKLAVNIPTDEFGVIPEDIYLENQNTRPGFGVDFGRMWFFNRLNMGDMVLGIDATFLSLNYNVIKGEQKLEAYTGQMIYKYDYRHISMSTNVGPSLTYLWNADLAVDVACKFAPTLNYFYYQHTMEYDHYKTPNVQLGLTVKVLPSINLRYKQYLIGFEYSYGSANYTDYRKNAFYIQGQSNDMNLSLNMFRILLGFKL